MMDMTPLHEETKSCVTSLTDYLTEILDSISTEHVQFTSQSFMIREKGMPDVLAGGTLKTKSKPSIKHDKNKLRELHKNILGSADNAIASIVVSGSRENPFSQWFLKTKVVTTAQYGELTRLRTTIESSIKSILKDITVTNGADRVSFGIDRPGRGAVVSIKTANGLKKSEPPADLVHHLDEVQSIYKNADLDLLVSYWTLEEDELTYREYFE